MGSESLRTLPVIDFCVENLNPNSTAWMSTCKAIRSALEEYGCFVAGYDRIPSELRNSIFSVAKELLDLPVDMKSQKTSHKPLHGYFPQVNSNPLFESIGIDNPLTMEDCEAFEKTMWPDGHQNFCKSVHSYAQFVAGLSNMVTRMVFESNGVKGLCDSHLESTTYLLRCIKYRPPLSTDETNVGLQPHTDATFLSILHDDVNGLQIKSKNGDWINVELSPSSFAVLAGDGFMAWSNGRITPCCHKVIMSVNQFRYSIGLFTFRSGLTHVPEELVTEDFPLKFNPFDNFDYLCFKVSQEGRKAECPVTAYCGVEALEGRCTQLT